MRWTTWTALAGILLPAALAGCVQPEEIPEEECEGWRAYWCECVDGCSWSCDDCPGVTPTPAPPPAVCPAYESWSSPVEPHDPCAPRPCQPAPYDRASSASPAICYVDPPMPLLGPFAAIPLGECATCAAPVVAASRADRVYVASEEALHVLPATTRQPIALPTPPIEGPEPWRALSLSLHVDADDRLWLAAISASGPVRALMVAEFAGDGFAPSVAVDLAHLPFLAIAERVHLASVEGALVVLLASKDAAWALRSSDGGASFGMPEAIAPVGGAAVMGAPTSDAKGRLLVPFAWTSYQVTPSLVSPASAMPSLHYAALASPQGAWTVHGGIPIAQGLLAGSSPALAVSRERSHLSWVDASGTLARLESTDDGASWYPAPSWSEPSAKAVGAPGATRGESSSTAAWWEEGGALVVGRASDLGEEARVNVASIDGPRAGAPLALRPDGRAVVAWATEGTLWVGMEGEANVCGPTDHCPRWNGLSTVSL